MYKRAVVLLTRFLYTEFNVVKLQYSLVHTPPTSLKKQNYTYTCFMCILLNSSDSFAIHFKKFYFSSFPVGKDLNTYESSHLYNFSRLTFPNIRMDIALSSEDTIVVINIQAPEDMLGQ